MKKYELTQKTISQSGKILHRIKALKDFGDVKVGDLGGYIDVESNLSHHGNCWVYDNARVSDNARVYGNAQVYDNAHVYGDARVSDNAQVSGNALVTDNAQVSDNAYVYGDAYVYDNAQVSGNAQILGKSHLKNFDEISRAEHCFNILGFKYPITVTPTSINIGCESYNFDMLDQKIEHEDFSQDEIKRIKMMIEMALEQILEKI
jgi:NDP-sugar pyrophosphorylase family protein